jgi:hypothetical protein
MAKKTRLELEEYFKAGDRPTESEFAELIESSVNIVDDKATDADLSTGTSNEKFITVLGAQKVARQSIKVNNASADPVTGNILLDSITGNAATATKLQTPRNINGVTFDGSANITLPAITTITGNAATATKLQTPRNINGVAFDGSANITLPEATTITGNAATATKLQTPRNINGVAFDGSTDITLPPSTLPRIIRMPSTIALSNVTTVQNTFSTINLLANKTYFFRGKYLLGNGIVTHTTAIGWAGTAVISSMEYVAKTFSSALNTVVATQSAVQVSGPAMKVVNATSTAATTTIEFEGVIRTGAAGTLLSQIQFVATQLIGGTNVVKTGSFIELNEIGSNTFDSIG